MFFLLSLKKVLNSLVFLLDVFKFFYQLISELTCFLNLLILVMEVTKCHIACLESLDKSLEFLDIGFIETCLARTTHLHAADLIELGCQKCFLSRYLIVKGFDHQSNNFEKYL